MWMISMRPRIIRNLQRKNFKLIEYLDVIPTVLHRRTGELIEDPDPNISDDVLTKSLSKWVTCAKNKYGITPKITGTKGQMQFWLTK